MMRLACRLPTERGDNVVAPVHDALMIEGPADSIEEIVARTQEAMAEASAVVLDSLRLRSDASIVRWPDRYLDGRGREFWGRVMGLLPSQADPSAPGKFDSAFGGPSFSVPSATFTRLASC
jgi:DNA polymerase-1